MYYDALTAAAVADELEELALGARVQRVLQPSRLSLALELYAGRRHQLLISAETQSAAVRLLPEKPRRGIEAPTPLLLRLRKHVEGARLERVLQPELERIVRLTFVGHQGTMELVTEVMGRHSNAILVAPDGTVMEALKRIPPTVSRVRPVLPGRLYAPPPPQAKEHPLALTPTMLRELLVEEGETPCWRALVSAAAGVSPLLAREVVHRALGRAEATCVEARGAEQGLIGALVPLLRLLETRAWAPCVALDTGRPVAYAPYALEQYTDRQTYHLISAAINAVAEAQSRYDPYEAVRGRVLAAIAERRERTHARCQALRRALPDDRQVELEQARGRAILDLAWSIAPGQEVLVVPRQMVRSFPGPPDQDELTLPLDPALSPAENAERHFQAADKLRAALHEVPPRIAKAELELAWLAQLATEAELADDRPALEEVLAALREGSGEAPEAKRKPRPRRDAGARGQPQSLRAPDGTLVLVGRSGRQNDEVTFRRAAPDDLWLHAHGVPGAHVIVRSGGAPVSEETLRYAAGLAARYSAARQEAQVQVDITPRRHVRKIKGAPPGMVTYSHERTLTVAPHAPGENDERGEW